MCILFTKPGKLVSSYDLKTDFKCFDTVGITIKYCNTEMLRLYKLE